MAPLKNSTKPSKAQAGPSSPPRQYLSKDIIESSDEEDDEGMEVDVREEEENASVDSHDDLEGVTPKRKDREDAESRRKSSAPKLKKYQPPAGMVPVQVDATLDESPFEYTQLERNPRLQLWAIRVPADLKLSRLAALTVAPPRKPAQHPKGFLVTKHNTYDLRSAEGGGDEMTGGMRLMVPHAQQDHRFFPSPIPISQQLMLVPRIEAAEDITHGAIAEMDLEEPGKRKQPTHLFKFRNQAYGYSTPGAAATQAEEPEEGKDVSMSPKKSKKDRKEKSDDRPAKKSRPSKTT